MTSLICEFCNKKYIRLAAFNNHVINCKFSRIAKSNLEFDTITNQQIDIKTVYKLLIDLSLKYDKLQDDYNDLKKYVNTTKKKIDIIDYLNQNFKYHDFNYNKFINSIEIGNDQLEIVFKKDYIEGILQILKTHIESLKQSDINIPIKSFNHQEGILYIYGNDNQWKIIDKSQLNQLIKVFNKKLLALFIEWKKINELIIDSEKFSEIYIINMNKVIAGNFEKKNVNEIIKNKLSKYLQQNLKNVVTYMF